MTHKARDSDEVKGGGGERNKKLLVVGCESSTNRDGVALCYIQERAQRTHTFYIHTKFITVYVIRLWKLPIVVFIFHFRFA